MSAKQFAEVVEPRTLAGRWLKQNRVPESCEHVFNEHGRKYCEKCRWSEDAIEQANVYRAYLAHLERAAAEKVERELPIDEAWLRSIGFETQHDSGEHIHIQHTVIVELTEMDVTVCNARPCIHERGQLLDLLQSLNLKEQAKAHPTEVQLPICQQCGIASIIRGVCAKCGFVETPSCGHAQP